MREPGGLKPTAAGSVIFHRSQECFYAAGFSINKVHVRWISPRCIDGKHDERMFEYLRKSMDNASEKKLHLSSTQLGRWFGANDKSCTTTDYDKVLVAVLVEMGWNWLVDTEYTRTRCWLIGEAYVD